MFLILNVFQLLNLYAEVEHGVLQKELFFLQHNCAVECAVLISVSACRLTPSILSLRRAKLFRFASANDHPEWKERGTGDVKLLKHKEKGTIRLLMRRDKTLKICANHYSMLYIAILPFYGLRNNLAELYIVD